MSNTRPRVLIVEDDSGVRRALERGLARGGFDTIGAANAGDALEADDFDVALVDLGLPDRDGVELCRELRTRFPERPIIVVTGRDAELDVVDALDAGADDYVTKPFSLAVLTARIRRHLDRSSAVTVIGALRIDRMARRASLAGEPVELTVREFDLLVALATRSGEMVSKDDLIATVWDAHWSKSTHTLDVHISALRAKLSSRHIEAPAIITVPKFGYRLDPVPSNR
ncbi:MAG TPA: response regulator transcription factor [Ilumatobacteraceae bacterium]|nr:response regulator transcription factor [Ilumatobacteraceae bacterium]